MNPHHCSIGAVILFTLGTWGCNQTTSPLTEDSTTAQDTVAIISSAGDTVAVPSSDCSTSPITNPCEPGNYSYLYTGYSGGPNINDYSHETTQISFAHNLASDNLFIKTTKTIHRMVAGPFVTQTGETVGFRTVDSTVLDTSYQSPMPLDSLNSRVFAPIDTSTWIKDSVMQLQAKQYKTSWYRRLIGGQAPEDRLIVHGIGVVALRYYATSRMGLEYKIRWNLLAINEQKFDSTVFDGYFESP